MHRSLGVAVALVVLLAAAGPAASLVAAQEDTPTPGENETSVQQVDPDETNQDGNLGGVQSALGSRLAERLEASSVQLSEGQYEAADQLLGDEYQDQYGKYVDVVGETDEEDAAETFGEARERQRELNEATREYNETREEYREAKRIGDQERAQRLARELEQQAENVSRSAERLRESYENVSEATGADLTRATTAVNETSETVAEQQAEVRDAEFVATNLTVSVESPTASFLDPATLSGRLTTENGTAVANRTITLRLNERTRRVATNANGEFMTRFRPVIERTGETSLTVRYLPEETSLYLGSNATQSVRIAQSEGRLSLTDSTEQAAFGDRIAVSGRLTVENDTVPGMPVVLTVDGTRVATAQTSANGSFTLSGELPVTIQSGEQPVRVSLGVENRAVTAPAVSRSLRVTETDTTLSASTSVNEESVELNGTLRTSDGLLIEGQTVEIRLNGSTVTTARTGPDGTYAVTVPAPPGTSRITVVYDEPTTNLGRATATAAVTIAGGDGGNPSGGLGQSILDSPIFAFVAVVLVGLAAGGWYLFGRESSSEDVQSEDEPIVADEGTSDPSAEPLAAARTELDENSDLAVERAYRAIRERLHAEGVGTADATHWEFYRTCVAAGIDESDALRALTRLYERAAFDPGSVSQEDARAAIERAGSLLG